MLNALLMIAVPGFAAVGAMLLAWFIMQSRMEVAIAKEREQSAEARGALEAEKKNLEIAIHGAEEAAKRKALEEFLSEMRVEERHYVREHKLLFMHRKSLVMQERIYFRNLPLSNWIEHEMMIEEGADIDKVAKSLTVFDKEVLSIEEAPRPRKFLR
jgi:hypothetical protein